MKPIKPALTYEQQIQKLTVEKGMIIRDKTFATERLKDISYYALIDGYKTLFYNPMVRKYKSGTTFEDILSIYLFDKALRELGFKYICIVEQKIRSLISYHFSEVYSHKQYDYLDPGNYLNTKRNRADISKLIAGLAYEVNVSDDHEYVVYQRHTYGNVPLWVVMKTITFGKMSKMYSLLNSSVKAKICRNFKGVSEKELAQHLQVLVDFRNICAHNERFYCHVNRHEIPNTPLHKKLNIPQRGSQYIYGKKDLFSVVISLRYLLPKNDFPAFKRELTALIKKAVESSNTLEESDLLRAMGFPTNWKAITHYKI